MMVNGEGNIRSDEVFRLPDDCVGEGQFLAQVYMNMSICYNFSNNFASVHGNLACHHNLN
jgi:hypothetical protein